MNPTVERFKLIFLGIFLMVNVAMLVGHLGWVWPADRCEKAHRWWDNETRICAQPVLISDVTGRTIQDKIAAEEAKKALGRPAAAAAKP